MTDTPLFPVATTTALEPTSHADMEISEVLDETLARWHNDDSGHPGAYTVCQMQPCHAIHTAVSSHDPAERYDLAYALEAADATIAKLEADARATADSVRQLESFDHEKDELPDGLTTPADFASGVREAARTILVDLP